MQELTFADVETELNVHLGEIRSSSIPNPIKRDMRIIGDIKHTYYFDLDSNMNEKDIKDKVEFIRKTFPDIYFSVRFSKNNVEDTIYGYYLRVGRIPLQVSLATEAIGRTLGEESDAMQEIQVEEKTGNLLCEETEAET